MTPYMTAVMNLDGRDGMSLPCAPPPVVSHEKKLCYLQPMAKAGYSGTPLEKKLGIRAGYQIRLIGVPRHYFELFDDFPRDVKLLTGSKGEKDFIHVFVTNVSDFRAGLAGWRKELAPAGMLWISWPKKASGVQTDLTEDIIRAEALKTDLVDVKVCAVDEIWSGLKLVIRVEKRKHG
ncbi:MAG: DUF3052 domain-containing protein [Cyclobacteriaceae bacterium]